MVYASSPLAYSFAETDQQKYVILIEAEAGKAVHYKSIPLQKGKRLLRARFDDIDKAVEWLAQNTNALVEITIETEKYLTAQERKKLNDIHSGICAIIPDVRRKDGIESSNKHIDITKNKIELFTDYFKYKNGGQVPNDRLLDLFKEITSIQSDEQEES
jgi:exonuclease SbcD